MSLQEISKSLFCRGMIVDHYLFRYMTALRLRSQSLKAGEYEIESGSSMSQIAEKMMYGKTLMRSISFPEGFTVRQIFQRLKENPFLVGDLPVDAMPLEGTLCPNTYRFSLGTRRIDIVEQAILEQKKLIDEIWKNRDIDNPILNKEDFVILASIVEKETSRFDERPRIASVFINRLAKSIRLQADSTVFYGLIEEKEQLSDRKLYRSDLSKKTPYNSYLLEGLPPTAISNPSRLSLESVAHPLKTNDLYFVSDGLGGHLFSENLKDHNINVQKLRQMSSKEKK
ncbi:MAG: endolytic transglycosylase MltG [Candidatus Liberibacter ctenarytainae]|uniref:Endolytic murein transglycosylase n=1 Tax=Candidatus Liberibacter ctenarytainae TaxID=2020335 RepID=A0A937AKP5_9HYPH|nr:endolytic transglycosylase MltG [Candidatus Liberibacter ctenarytainae]